MLLCESFNLAGGFAAVMVNISALEKAMLEWNYILKVLSCNFSVCSCSITVGTLVGIILVL